MRQSERTTKAAYDWEPTPWHAGKEVAERQLEGYRERSAKLIQWQAIRSIAPGGKLFGLEKQWFVSRDIEYFAEHDDEQLLLIQLAWHGFPDPPEWGLVSRAAGNEDVRWSEWGYFANLPACWSVPQGQ